MKKTECRAVALLIMLSACASACSPVAPWQRGILAKSSMALEPNPMQSSLREHTHGSREAASGSSSASGGGCGCY
ncbi:MAG: DUF4266 domain-containing protein [Methylobacter sp.]|nr:MAG: DUF4266 domain-containing protein [Methylobacter sp.]